MKKLKYLLLAVFVSCAFVLAGCGDGQLGVKAEANIGNPENYVEATEAQEAAFTEILNDEEAVGVKSYRITAEMGMAGTTTKMNCIYNVAGETLELAMKMEATVEGRSEVVKCWVKDDSAYGEFSGESGKMIEEMVGTNKIKEAVDGEMLSDLIESLDTLTLEYCVERGKELDLTLPEIGLKVDVQDGVTRYEISNEDADGVKIYFVFEEGVLTSVQMEMASSSYMGATSVKVVIEAFDGEIEFPDFGGFKDVTALMG